MTDRAQHVVQNIGAIAETTSIFYNTIAKQVPKDVAIVLTQHFMDITIAKRPVNAVNPAAARAAAKAVAEFKAMEERRHAEEAKAEAEKREEAEQPKKTDLSEENPAT